MSATEKAQLRVAIETGAIEVLFQPQFASVDDRLAGAEALARWEHPERGGIDGAELFCIAQRSGQGESLWRHVSQAAMIEAAGWRIPLRLSLNVTAAELASEHFPDSVLAMLAESALSPDRLTLEITEQSLVDDLDRSADKLQVLADRGVRIALDDFGAGFCNFDYLKRLPLHYLKLDRRMVQGIEEDHRDLAIFRAIIAMARALDLKVIAEGIERPAQRDAARREGSTTWQGYLGSRPLTSLDFATLLSK